ncbi:MAG: HTTM domain-containing protein [Methylacidiphilales bacterium]|nr:HTTM domain-containing protein [Candidatus Methylacidiphilales bacterium]
MHLDPRSLALFRIALGSVTLWVAWQLAPDYFFFFDLPSAHSPLIWALLHVFLPLFSIFLILGFFSRLSSIFCWFGVIAVQQANPHILYGADRLLHLLLYWSIFLPLGETGSVDAWLFKKRAPRLLLTDRWGAWGITGQICFVYWFTALARTDPVWTQNRNALFYALNIDYLTSAWGAYMLHFPVLLRWLTTITLYLEFLGPFLLFVPLQRDRFRLAAVVLFLSFHLIGMQFLLRIGYFPWVCATAWLIFIPGFFWNTLTGPIGRYFHGVNPTGWVRLLDLSMAGLALFSFADILVWNVVSLPDPKAYVSKSEAWMKTHDPSMGVLHLDQRWHMYARPYPHQGWYVIPAELADGSQVDLFTNRPVSWDRPRDFADYLGNIRWRVYLANLEFDRDPETLRQYSDYLADQWDKGHPENRKVKTTTLIFMSQTTLPNLTITEPKRVILFTKKY